MIKYNFLINDLTAGGAERVLSNICNELCKEERVRLIKIGKSDFYQLSRNVDVVSLAVTGFFFFDLLLSPFTLSLLSRRHKIGVLQSHLFYANYVNVLSTFLGARHKVQMVHCVAFSAKFKKKNIKRFIHLTIMGFLSKASSLHIFKSEAMKADFLSIFNIMESKAVVIYNPCNIQSIMNQSNERNILFDDNFHISVMGRFHETKGQWDIINAMPSFPEDVFIHFFGDGPTLDSCRKRSLELGMGERVKFYGKLKNPFPYIKASNIYLSNSLAEGFPNALIEALACGKCCIHSDCLSGPREILSPKGSHLNYKVILEEFGVLYPVSNIVELISAIRLLRNNHEIIANYESKANLRAQRFDFKLSIQKYKECFFD